MTEKLWDKLETENFIFFYPPKGFVKENIQRLSMGREKAFLTLNKIFQVQLPEKIRWFFLESEEKGIKLLGDVSPNQALAPILTIFTVYNEKHDSTPGHELTHILSFYWNSGFTNSYKFLSEGLARSLDQSSRDSFVKWLIDDYDWEKFAKVWLVKNDLSLAMEKIYGASLEKLENFWLEFLSR
ncbi:MAG: hypothetical protein UT91_C0037G0004 [Parcubacteria group bacterium GW2011_GWA2_40_23]|nr:MAG: hypothetical protein UT91_C0037G0004 [Parcubacteria group bacterium GW2011_GWA2_40_23]